MPTLTPDPGLLPSSLEYPGGDDTAPQTIVGAELLSQLGWLAGDVWLANYMDAIGALFQDTANIVVDVGSPDDEDYQTGYGIIFTVNPRFEGDTAICPTDQLPYLAQFVGVPILPGTPEATARSLIANEAGFQRGTPSAIVAAAQRYLTGTQSVVNLQRTRPDGVASALWFTLIVRPEEVVSESDLIGAVTAVTPAWLQWGLIEQDGYTWAQAVNEWHSDTMTWQQATNTQP